jgi:2-polyprenyl-3-methyl-5-hydroxy-6-metoxy-1,4-benzoquinol methylase
MSEEKRSLKDNIVHTRCLVCNSDSLEQNHISADWLVSGETFPVMRCKRCGFMFTNNYPAEEFIGKYYKSEEYISHSNSTTGLSGRLYKFARTLMLSRKRKLISAYITSPGSTLLDIGCGTGHFVAFMKRYGWDAAGIERDIDARQYAAKINKIKVEGDESMNHLPPSHYDVITLWHVLEHFHDPDTAIRQVAGAMKPDGIIVAALPNHYSYDAHHYGPDWAAWDVPRHLWHFNPDSLSLFTEKHNLKIIKKVTMPFDSFYVSILSEKAKGSGVSLIMGMFRGLLSLTAALVNVNKSSSVIYILKKVGS